MKKFLFRAVVLTALLMMVDAFVGVACRYLQTHAKYGDTRKVSYIADRMDADMLVFGASRAVRHYVPRILEDSLGMSCYNCGQQGNGIVFSYGQYRLFRDRYVPKLIVCDIYPPFDLLELDDAARGSNKSQLGQLRPFYDRTDTVFWEVDATERWQMLSQMRRYNRRFVQMTLDCVRPFEKIVKGYKTNGHGVMVGGAVSEDYEDHPCDDLKMRYWRHLVADCKARGTRLVFAASPAYGGRDESKLAPLRELARRESIPFLIHYNDSAIAFEKRYFYDWNHLNADGAEIYTKIIASELKKLLSEGVDVFRP